MLRLKRVVAQIKPALEPISCEGGDAVLFEVDQKTHVATIHLNRPKERNAMTQELLNGVREAARKAQEDPNVRCVLLTADGTNFCGGAAFGKQGGSDKSMANVKPIWDEEVAPGGRLVGGERNQAMYSNFLSLLEIKVPIVGALQGHAIGGGFGLVLMADIRVANEDSQYGVNFVRLGMHPGMATTYLVNTLIGYEKAAKMFYTGRLITGKEMCEEFGLCSYYAKGPDAVKAKARQIAEEIAANAPIALRWTKRSLRKNGGLSPGVVRDYAWDEAQLQSRTNESEDFKEGTRALVGKRDPQFQGK